MTETQATVHKCQAWFHGGMSRDKANKILQAHASTDGYVIDNLNWLCHLKNIEAKIITEVKLQKKTNFVSFRVFLVRDSSVAGGFVISVTAANKNIHSQVLPVSSLPLPSMVATHNYFPSFQLSTPDGVVYSVDDGKTKFYDLLQLVEFYQLNTGSLPTRSVSTTNQSSKPVEIFKAQNFYIFQSPSLTIWSQQNHHSSSNF